MNTVFGFFVDLEWALWGIYSMAYRNSKCKTMGNWSAFICTCSYSLIAYREILTYGLLKTALGELPHY